LIAFIRELANILFSITTKALLKKNMSHNNEVEMVINTIDDLFNKCDNYDEMRGCTLVFSIHHPRSPSLSSSDSKEDYVTRVPRESDRMVENGPVALANSSQLEYVTPKNKFNQVSKVAEPLTNTRQ